MRFAWVEGERIRDVCNGGLPAHCYHPDVAQYYTTEVPDEAKNGDFWINGQLVKPEIPEAEPLPQPPRTWSLSEVRSQMTLLERVKWDNDKTDVIKTAKIELSYPRYLGDVEPLLDLLVYSGDIAEETKLKILGQL